MKNKIVEMMSWRSEDHAMGVCMPQSIYLDDRLIQNYKLKAAWWKLRYEVRVMFKFLRGD